MTKAALREASNDLLDPLDPKVGKNTTDFEHLVDPNYQPGEARGGSTPDAALNEDDPMMGGGANMGPDAGTGAAPTPEDEPTEPPGDHFDNAFKTEINSILDGPGDEDEMASKISALLEHRKGIKEIRGGGPEAPGDAGADMEETEPDNKEEEKDDKPPFKESAPPDVKLDKDGKPIKETAKPNFPQATSRARLARELIETVITPCVDLLNAHQQPVTGNMLMSVALMPSKRRHSFVASLPRASNIAPRSQAGAIGIHETSPHAANRPAKPGTQAPKAAPKRLSETDPKLLLSFARGVRPLVD